VIFALNVDAHERPTMAENAFLLPVRNLEGDACLAVRPTGLFWDVCGSTFDGSHHAPGRVGQASLPVMWVSLPHSPRN
jgi:hypothetical protein